jgi:hypothetical protein
MSAIEALWDTLETMMAIKNAGLMTGVVRRSYE